MRIGYLARHESGLADDEGAITHALESLGHHVERLRERRSHVAFKLRDVDWLLFHHCHDYDSLRKVTVPKVMWAFDLITYDDPLLKWRNKQRLEWMRHVIPLIDVGFLTDGDFVANDKTGKLSWLPQGADERVIGPGTAGSEVVPLLFTGGVRGCGTQRIEFVRDVQERYGSMFKHVEKGIYGRELADLIASTQIVLAPSGPVSSRYWSNRVYNVLGFGGFLLHPYSEGLAAEYSPMTELIMYHSTQDLHDAIKYYLDHPEDRLRIARNGWRRTVNQHTYRHRVAEMVEIVKGRLGLS